MTASLTSPADSSGQNTQTPQTQTLHAQTASSADAVTTSETPTEAATSLDNPLLRSQPVTVNAVSASIKLLRGQTTADQPASETLGAEYFQRLGATGSFTVNTDDLVAGNTIVITPIAQSSTEPTGALAGFCGDGSGIKLEDQQGRNVGIIYYDSNLKAIVLRVATTISDPGQTQTYSFIGPWFMVINYNTPFPVIMKMPFSNTLTICGQSYTFNFLGMKKVTDALSIGNSAVNINARSNVITYAVGEAREVIPDNPTFTDLQNSGGQSGAVNPPSDFLKTVRFSSSQNLQLSAHFGYNTSVYYVSAQITRFKAINQTRLLLGLVQGAVILPFLMLARM